MYSRHIEDWTSLKMLIEYWVNYIWTKSSWRNLSLSFLMRFILQIKKVWWTKKRSTLKKRAKFSRLFKECLKKCLHHSWTGKSKPYKLWLLRQSESNKTSINTQVADWLSILPRLMSHNLRRKIHFRQIDMERCEVSVTRTVALSQ